MQKVQQRNTRYIHLEALILWHEVHSKHYSISIGPKRRRNGKCPIMGRITIDGKQVQYSTGKEIAPELWDSRKGRCKGTGEEIKEINRYLQAKEEQAKAKYQELVWQRGYITAELLKCELMEEDKPKGFLLEEARLFIEEKHPLCGGNGCQADLCQLHLCHTTHRGLSA